MEFLASVFNFFYETFGPGIFILLGLFAFVGIVAQWKLYEKSGLPGYACLVPVWNVTSFLKIVGRPAWHIVYFLVPVYNIYFIVKVYIELCNAFGQNKLIDYILIVLFNGFYVLHLGLSYDIQYKGPVYGLLKEKAVKGHHGSPQLA